jgi:large subunit ribosomal protein L22
MAEKTVKTIKKTAEVKATKKAVTTKAAVKVKEVKAEAVAQNKVEFKVFVKNAAMSPLKLRLVANLVRGRSVENALNSVEFLNKKGSSFIKKAINSGIANAREQAGVDKKVLYVKSISVGEGDNLKRFQIASRSRVARIVKRRSHINLVLGVK